METEDERARLENNAATKRLRLVMETEEERKARLVKMVATTQLRLVSRSRPFPFYYVEEGKGRLRETSSGWP